MNARILALGAVLVLAASTVDAQTPAKGKGGWGKGKPTADSTASKSTASDDDKHGMRMGHDDARRAGPGKGQGYLFAGIDLTDTQKTRIKAIHESYRPRMQAVRDSARVAKQDGVTNAADSTFRLRHEALMTAQRAELRAVLTTEQQARFDVNAKRMEDRMGRRFGVRGQGKGRRGGPGGSSL